MPNNLVPYSRYRFPPSIISHAVWLYYRFTLSFRDVEDLLAHRGITVSYESIWHWYDTFGLAYAQRLRIGPRPPSGSSRSMTSCATCSTEGDIGFGPAIEGTTSARLSFRVSVNTGSDDLAVRNMPCALA